MGCVYKRGSTYWIKFYDRGRPIYESSGSADWEVAKQLLRRREGAIGHERPVRRPAEQITLEEAFADFLNDYKAQKRKTLKHAERRIEKHLLPFFRGRGIEKLSAVTTIELRAFAAQRQEAGASNAEINRELGVLSRAFALAIESERIVGRPKFPRFRESAPRSGFFEREQFESVRGHLPYYAQGPVTFMYETGWRKQEVFDLKWKNVDFRGRLVRLDVGTTKTGEGRIFPFTTTLRILLEQQRELTRRFEHQFHVVVPFVFHHNGRRIWTIWRCWGTACRRAGVAGRVPHDFRRTACRNLVNAGVPEKVAMTMVGWRTRKMMDRYHIVNEADLREAVRKLERVGDIAP